MIRSVISDLGKVLISFDNSIFYNKIAEHSPFDVQEIAARVNVHSDIAQAFDTGRITPRGFYEKALEVLQVTLGYEDFFALYNDVFTLNPEVVATLNRLKPKYRMVMLSNTDVMRFGFIKDRFPEVLLFDEYVLSYEVGRTKPHRRVYEIAVDKSEVSPNECLFIDDRQENIEAARQLGIQTIHYLEGSDLGASLRTQGLVLR
jgi:putative hydrolase of the HAD superfamily